MEERKPWKSKSDSIKEKIERLKQVTTPEDLFKQHAWYTAGDISADSLVRVPEAVLDGILEKHKVLNQYGEINPEFRGKVYYRTEHKTSDSEAPYDYHLEISHDIYEMIIEDIVKFEKNNLANI